MFKSYVSVHKAFDLEEIFSLLVLLRWTKQSNSLAKHLLGRNMKTWTLFALLKAKPCKETLPKTTWAACFSRPIRMQTFDSFSFSFWILWWKILRFLNAFLSFQELNIVSEFTNASFMDVSEINMKLTPFLIS